jgi:hypothetical protein
VCREGLHVVYEGTAYRAYPVQQDMRRAACFRAGITVVEGNLVILLETNPGEWRDVAIRLYEAYKPIAKTSVSSRRLLWKIRFW